MSDKATKYGIMAGLTTPFDAAGRFDEKSFGLNIERSIERGAHTVYTTGGAAEFFSIEIDDFETLVKAYARATTGWNGNRQIGCSWISTQGVIDRIKLCLDSGIDQVQITLPFWIALAFDEVRAFFSRVSEKCPGAKLIHYNASQSRNVLTGKHYARLMTESPNLVAAKITTPSFLEWTEIVINAPELECCCCEPIMVPAFMTGAAGVASSWFFCSPDWFKRLFDLCVREEWSEAMKLQMRMHEAYHKVVFPIDDTGVSDAAGDKALAALGGFLGGIYTRNPLKPMDDDVFEQFKAAMRRDFADILPPSKE